jgi:hypothetical protein
MLHIVLAEMFYGLWCQNVSSISTYISIKLCYNSVTRNVKGNPEIDQNTFFYRSERKKVSYPFLNQCILNGEYESHVLKPRLVKSASNQEIKVFEKINSFTFIEE